VCRVWPVVASNTCMHMLEAAAFNAVRTAFNAGTRGAGYVGVPRRLLHKTQTWTLTCHAGAC
jgi:hypothetical protein